MFWLLNIERRHESQGPSEFGQSQKLTQHGKPQLAAADLPPERDRPSRVSWLPHCEGRGNSANEEKSKKLMPCLLAHEHHTPHDNFNRFRPRGRKMARNGTK